MKMKLSFFKPCLALLLIIIFQFAPAAQTLNWDANLAKPQTFTSLNPDDDPDVTVDQMWQVSVKDLMKLRTDPVTDAYGIKAILNDKERGFVKVRVYLYDDTEYDPDDEDRTQGRGPLIFECFMNKDNQSTQPANGGNDYELGEWLAWWPDTKETDGGFYFNDGWESNDARSAMMAAAFYDYNKKFTGWNGAQKPGSAVIPYSSIQTGDYKLPVIIEVDVFKANATSITLPGIGLIEPGYFKPPYLDIQLAVNTVYTDAIHVNVSIPTPESPDNLNLYDITLNISRFGDRTPLATQKILKSQIPYTNTDLTLSLGDKIAGEFWIWASYNIDVKDGNNTWHPYENRQQFLANYNVNISPITKPYVYTISKQDYNGLPVFTLKGGMSAEYVVEKTLASLLSGVSETWDVRTVDGKPDLEDGGPVSIHPDANAFDFLDRSINKTIDLYNNNLGPTTEFNTVIVGTGVAHMPYMTSAMNAPFLPLQFLVSIHSVTEVQRILDRAKGDGYSAFSMMGYDPSVDDIGVAWIRLKELPPQYLKFLRDHKVKNLIIMGYQEGYAAGESGARRIWIEGQPDDDYTAGSMYMMGHGPLKDYKGFYKDYYRWNFSEEKNLIDWEGGLANVQVQDIAAQLGAGSGLNINTFAIRATESLDFYQWATDIQMAALVKNNGKPQMISMNEYLIGFPNYELYTNTVPYLYWQGGDTLLLAGRTWDYTNIKVKPFYQQGGPFTDIPVYFQSKIDRKSYMNALKKYFTNVTQDNWQKADVWDISDGMQSPCELIAVALTKTPDGPKNFAAWNSSRSAFNFDDFSVMAKNSVAPSPSSDPNLFPKPSGVTELKKIEDAGFTITKYNYDFNTYWQPPNFPNLIEMRSLNNGFPGNLMGYMDGQQRPNDIRKQAITISQFDLENTSDEYDLKMAYKFNVTKDDGLSNYDPLLGEEQNMDCFEFTSIPYNHWLDIPSRMMARAGAVWILNGGVYDFDYNGLPGVVPFIKKTNNKNNNIEIKAQPQILSFKGEAAFGWKWGSQKSAGIVHRPADIPAKDLAASMKLLFQNETKDYPNALGAMTYMTGQAGSGLYDIKALQPGWMKDYPPFPPYYLGADRCFYAPLSLRCAGTEVVAPIEDGWNDCSILNDDNAIQRFSSLAYQQFPRTFDEVPNARTFVALKGKKLDIGIIDGDYGDGKSYRGRVATKTMGMHVYEQSQFCLAKQYDNFVNLDGGSSTQMWLNGRGPLQMMNSYIKTDDNQGPYYSRLVSSFIMLVPKLHTELINQTVQRVTLSDVPLFDNTHINFTYSDEVDLVKPKAFIDLSPCKDSLNKADGAYGMIAGNFTMSQYLNEGKKGGILFYTGEEMFYPETKGLATVHPRLRNLMVIGVGNVLPSLVDTIQNMPDDATHGLKDLISDPEAKNISVYYIKIYDGEVTDYIIQQAGNPARYLTGDHRFVLRWDGREAFDGIIPAYFTIDGKDVLLGARVYYSYLKDPDNSFLNMGVSTHAYIGALNLDGRFLTGDIAIKPYNYLFAVGREAWTKVYDYTAKIDAALANKSLPDFRQTYYEPGMFALQCLETSGRHVFALAQQGQNRFYGLRLNNFFFKKKMPDKKPIKGKTK